MKIENSYKLALGGCPLGAHGWGETSDVELNRVVSEAIDSGVNFIDTADVYGNGKSESLIAKNLHKIDRDEIIISSKFGVRLGEKTFYDNSEKWFWESLHGSLKRLKTDYIDLYQVHYWDGFTNFEDICNFFHKAFDQGKIRYMGVSNIDRDLLPKRLPAFFKTYSFEYNILENSHLGKINKFSQDKDLIFLSWGSLCQGLLSGNINDKTLFFENDRRSRDSYKHFHNDLFKSNLSKVEKLKSIAKVMQVSPASFSLNWILNTIDHSISLFGSTKLTELNECIKDECNTIEEKILEKVEYIQNEKY